MAILITKNKQSLAVFTAAFCFGYSKHKFFKLKLYNKCSVQAVHNILESAM